MVGSSLEKNNKRIEWCDIYKGIIILLVVLGHVTGMFNQYIYQFHMAAFFFISGYTNTLNGKSLIDVIIEKFYKLMVPYIVLYYIVGVTLFVILQKNNILHYVSTSIMPDSLIEAYGRNTNVDWFGAMWFLPVLFWATILLKFLLKISNDSTILLFLLSFLLFLLAENRILSGVGNTNIYLAGVAQLYMVIGCLMRDIDLDKIKSTVWYISGIIIAVFWCFSVKNISSLVMDWPTRNFNGIIDIYLPIMGILLTICISNILSKWQLTKNVMICLGRNSMGIMCFHFIGFKVAYAFLCVFNQMSWKDVYMLVPSTDVSEKFWWIILIIALSFSLVCWTMICGNKVLYYCVGGCEGKKVTQLIKYSCKNLKFFSKCEKKIVKFWNVFKSSVYVLKIRRWSSLIILLILCGILGTSVIEKIERYTIENIDVTFPDDKGLIEYKSGWLEQSADEAYRWIQQESEFNVILTSQNIMEIVGYIPENVEGITSLVVKMNDNIVYKQSVTPGGQIAVEVNIAEYIKRGSWNKIVFELDASRKPKETDIDKREFSALINEIKFYE